MNVSWRWLWLVALMIGVVLGCVVTRCVALAVPLPDRRWLTVFAAITLACIVIPLWQERRARAATSERTLASHEAAVPATGEGIRPQAAQDRVS